MRYLVTLLGVGSILLALGLYLLGSAIVLYDNYERNLAACDTAPWCGGPPPPVWSSASVLSIVVPLIFIGSLAITWGIVGAWRERRGRLALAEVQAQSSS